MVNIGITVTGLLQIQSHIHDILFHIPKVYGLGSNDWRIFDISESTVMFSLR